MACQSGRFAEPTMRQAAQKWRKKMGGLQAPVRRDCLLRELREMSGNLVTLEPQVRSLHGTQRVQRALAVDAGKRRLVNWRFLGVPVCFQAYRRLSGVNPWRILQDLRRGAQCYTHAGFQRPSVIEDEMHGAIWTVVRHFAQSSPLAPGTDGHLRDPDEILMPFHEKIYLFRVLQLWYSQWSAQSSESSGSSGSPGSSGSGSPPRPTGFKPLFIKEPKYRTFLKVLRRPEFGKVRFHRVVSMARCPRCCFLRWRCMSSPPESRGLWQRLAAAHQCLQLAQKRAYAADRAVASSDYPRSEIYMAMDGGSGSEFVLPHMAAHDVELPSKALASFHSLPMKVLNGLVHGDTRAHVILSPGAVVAGANHICEGIAILMNTAFMEHGNLPRRASVQLDNASTNHNMLVLVFMGLYVPVVNSMLRGGAALRACTSHGNVARRRAHARARRQSV